MTPSGGKVGGPGIRPPAPEDGQGQGGASGEDGVREDRAVWLLAVACAVIWVIFGQLSPGTYSDDDLSHFFLARESLDDPSLAIGLYARPLFTLLYAVPASLGYGFVELLTALVCALTVVLTHRLARAVGVEARLVAAFCCALQPYFFRLGYACLVEPLAALCLTAALAALFTRRDRTAAFLAGLLPLTRLELLVVTPFLLVPLLRRNPLRVLLAAALPLVAWNVAGWSLSGEPLWLVTSVLRGAMQRSLTGQPLSHYFVALPLVVGGAWLPLFLTGIACGWRDAGAASRNLVRLAFLVFFATLALLAWEIHDFGSNNGLLRHLVTAAPLIAVITAMGVDEWKRQRQGRARTGRAVLAAGGALFGLLIPLLGLHLRYWERPGRPELMVWSGAAGAALTLAFLWSRPRLRRLWPAGIVLIAAISLFLTQRPMGLHREQQAMGHVAAWHARYVADRITAVNHPWFFFLGGYDRKDRERFVPVTQEALRGLPPGSLVIWESHYSHRILGDVMPADLSAQGDRFVQRRKVDVGPNFFLAVYEVVSPEGSAPR